MRNRMKQLLNKEDGFTLVELLGVIVILGLIIAIAIPGIGKIVENAREKTADAQQELILDAAQLYFLQEGDNATSVTVETLIEKDYLEDKPGLSDNETVITQEEAKSGKLTNKESGN
ncbi:prepilin-type N-terminal cleavage/methylation domain-containing protein [Jeotgalibaca ciconiae]|uniref:Prepilin-type N-terminal cleavage/methylation domain-containing protein n=1 Tax=Jeotgalibaca ciconiae TaxID=2496265 RepID=A0A3Q9BLD1_9LACT|nr:prepilin-type N-terminal cleavage/methylation domain-containing protein [Jeotgalibaca ciconiae]AZP03673.1 prepilin-type N-terminal cleavage/methylation domain-containing protein [Jeotgalibaca ciconiae]